MSNADTLRFDIVSHVILIVHADVAPDANDWKRMMIVRDAHHDKLRGVLVVAPPRAKLSASQRSDVTRSMRETGASTAVVTDSALVRGVARAIGFLGVPVRAFSPTEVASALNFLAIPPTRHDDFIRRIEALKMQLSSRPPQMPLQKDL